MKSEKETFTSLMLDFGYRDEVRGVFDDFLTMSICALSQNPALGKSNYEDEYLETIAKYKGSDPVSHFPKMFACLVIEMEERVNDGLGNDVLGNFYELHLSRKGASQYFTPWPICEFMAQVTTADSTAKLDRRPRILDPSCGSGRMLLAGAKHHGKDCEFYGIDIDHMCVKMAVINLFLNGVFHAEIMCADALLPGDFTISYVTSFLPFGIYKIREKENSPLWLGVQDTFSKKPEKPSGVDLKPPSETNDNFNSSKGSQLQLF